MTPPEDPLLRYRTAFILRRRIERERANAEDVTPREPALIGRLNRLMAVFTKLLIGVLLVFTGAGGMVWLLARGQTGGLTLTFDKGTVRVASPAPAVVQPAEAPGTSAPWPAPRFLPDTDAQDRRSLAAGIGRVAPEKAISPQTVSPLYKPPQSSAVQPPSTEKAGRDTEAHRGASAAAPAASTPMPAERAGAAAPRLPASASGAPPGSTGKAAAAPPEGAPPARGRESAVKDLF